MKKMEKVERMVFTVPEVAKMLGINVVKAYTLARREDFPSIRIGRRIVVPKDAFHRWLDLGDTEGA
ncbi:MAG: helix-turn-helix domain-containing protein [Thermovirgaceae bacterium]|nr:helix-turn-helix domain-containing protein [Synergistales bacterium]HPC76107.1 helix-turn-helix domain-containing protein [Synergistales bacterium]HRS48784.1 helix-turn-helix domain-containing protein [Thermovirgaceae bacterium]HRU90988.1 helix-turn-helix domain-containing protein [Thermovirgaceae bacterium]